jgi:fructose-1,6-bisphosphatase/inositol monophosphatase family enzyme
MKADDKYGVILVEAAKLAASTMMNTSSKVYKTKYEWGGVDALTKADIATEKALRRYFSTKLPGYNIFGEELGGKYNNNGKAILIDPIDGTSGFAKGFPVFGTIIGIYENGRNVAGVECNVMRDKMCVATEKGMEYIGMEEKKKNHIYYGVWGTVEKGIEDAVFNSLKKEFKGYKIFGKDPKDYSKKYDIMVKAWVFNGFIDGLVSLRWSRHDIAASPIMARLSGVKITNHRGEPYDMIDFSLEERRYKSKDREWIYSCPIVIGRPAIHKRLLNALAPFRKELDKIADYQPK